MLPDSLEIAILKYKSPQICILKTTAEGVTKARDDNTVRVKLSLGSSMHRDQNSLKVLEISLVCNFLHDNYYL